MNKKEILGKVIELFSTMTEAEVNEDSEIMEDLDLSSMDVLFLISSLEDAFKVKIPEKAIRKVETVSDVAYLIMSNYEQNGV